MSRTSRPLGLSLALVLAAATTAGCGVSGSPGGEVTELSVTASATDRSAMGSVVAEFRRLHPDIRVKTTFADIGTLQKELPDRLRAGEGPDVFTVWPGNGNPASVAALEHDDLLENLSLRHFTLRIPEEIRSVVGESGGSFVVPVSFSAIGAVWSERTLEAVGGTPPRTWTELLGLCDTAREHGKVLLALGNETAWVRQLITYALVATTVYAHEPDFDMKMEFLGRTFADSGWKAALRKYLEMEERGCFGSGSLDTTYEESLDQVVGGQALGTVQIASALPALRAADPAVELRMTALPATDEAAETRMPGAVSAAYGVRAGTPRRKAAFAFIDFLGSEAGQNLYNRTGATLPALPNESFTVDPAVKEVASRQKDGSTVSFMDQHWPNSRVQQTHFEQIEALLGGRTDVDAALEALDAAYRRRD
ncbi:ABC transporter substrate-binding protein [Streptomyces sp. NPDC059166]|uniref:ABC transporter substrate-binding protein n=1 Tax=Streptomyces sp. NPDC059166 TaxID=3346752 RepID=UPI0036D0E07C